MDTKTRLTTLASRTLARAGGLRGLRVICAVSGGADSVALLRLMREVLPAGGMTLAGACHLEHGIRGEDSLGDMLFVKNLCEELDLPFYAERADVPRIAGQGGGGLETVARDVRRAFYLRAMAALSAQRVALGHHADDQAETVLMHLLRGAHATKGMEVDDGVLLRPLLEITRGELEAYLAQIGASYRTDATNQVCDNPRNALRQQVMPALKALYPGGVAALGRAARYGGEDEALLMGMSEAWLSQHHDQGCLSLVSMPDLPILRRALAAYARACGAEEVTSPLVDRLVELCAAPIGARLALGGMVWERWAGGLLRVPAATRYACVPFNIQGETLHHGAGWRFMAQYVKDLPPVLSAAGNVQVFDADKLADGLRVRARVGGDRMRPYGAPGHKPLKDVLIDKKAPRALRDHIPLLADGSDILWAVGVARGHAAQVDSNTRRILCVEYSKINETIE